MQLLLFDIDGTLIESSPAGKATLTYALEEVFGAAGESLQYSIVGKTDSLIVREIMEAAGFRRERIEANLETIYEAMAERGRTLFFQDGIRACPGVPSLLASLAQRQDVALGLLTGNNSRTAPLKLAAAGIDPGQFIAGAYGSDAEDRNILASVAVLRAEQVTGRTFASKDVIVVGDTPADILCARAIGAKSVAVATGNYRAEALADFQPDLLLEDLADTQGVLAMLSSKLQGSR